jgi:hypothetical protein
VFIRGTNVEREEAPDIESKYSTYKQSKEEVLKVMERKIPNRFTHSESRKPI